AAQQSPALEISLPRLQVPEGSFARRPRHPITADAAREGAALRGRADLPTDDKGSHEIADDNPSRIGRLVIVEWSLRRSTFAPSSQAISEDFDQNNPALGRAPETGLERRHDRQ